MSGLRIDLPITNRAGLSHVSYRIGRYGDFRAFMTARLDGSEPLRGFGYRRADDSAMALLEGASITLDILTFYQEHYANQAFLRPATWRESIVDLVYLTGYRPRPAVGGRGAFAFEFESGQTAQLPTGVRLRADLEGLEKAVDLETEEPLEARGGWGRIPIQRPVAIGRFGLLAPNHRVATHRTIRFLPTDPNDLPVEIAKGDRLLLGAASRLTPPFEIRSSQTAIVAAVRSERGVTVVDLVGSFNPDFMTLPVVALKVGRTFKHFGQSAPRTFASVTGGVVSTKDVDFHMPQGMEAANAAQFEIDGWVDDLSVGSYALWTAAGLDEPPRNFAVLGAIVRTTLDASDFKGVFSGPRTVVELDTKPTISGVEVGAAYDVRTLLLREIIGKPMRALPLEVPTPETRGHRLEVFLAPNDAEALVGRTLLLVRDGSEPVTTTVTAVGRRISPWTDDRPSAYPITIDRELDYADVSRMTAFGNVAWATQGRREDELAIGSGDARATHQTFPLPAQTLTYLVRPGPASVEPELDVLVRGESWMRVDALFGAGPNEHVYVVRQDDDGRSYVGFGDGIDGARLPTGVDNVTVRFRSGAGAFGPLADGASVSTRDRVKGLKAIRLPGIVSGGAAAETAEHAKRVAPARTQTLGRLVTLQDIGTEAARVPGVARALAGWALRGGTPSIRVTVLMESGRERELSDVGQILEHAYRCRGPGRHPLFVEQAQFVDVEIAVRYGQRFGRRRSDLEHDLRAALGAESEGGLFGSVERELGAVEYRTRIEGILQNVSGVAWTSVDRLTRAGVTGTRLDLVPCAPNELLRLKRLDLAATATSGEVCDG